MTTKPEDCVRCAIGMQQAHEQDIPYDVGNCPDCLGTGYTDDCPECIPNPGEKHHKACPRGWATFRQSSSPAESDAESVHSGKQNTADKSELLPTQLEEKE